MTTFVSLLRGVNVAGHRRLKMSELAEAYTSLGFADVRTYVQSGNVIFSNNAGDVSSVGKQIEERLRSRLGLDVTVFIRTPNELGKLVAKNPFEGNDLTKLHVTFLYTMPVRVPTDKVKAVQGDGEAFSVTNRE